MSLKIQIICVFIFVVAVSVYGQVGQFKPGDCPPLPDVGICEMTCFADSHCSGSEKCCRTACGGTFCTRPITMRQMQRQHKPGYCPAVATGPWVCSSRCAFDTDCRGNKKCCKNRCGAFACTKPEA